MSRVGSGQDESGQPIVVAVCDSCGRLYSLTSTQLETGSREDVCCSPGCPSHKSSVNADPGPLSILRVTQDGFRLHMESLDGLRHQMEIKGRCWYENILHSVKWMLKTHFPYDAHISLVRLENGKLRWRFNRRAIESIQTDFERARRIEELTALLSGESRPDPESLPDGVEWLRWATQEIKGCRIDWYRVAGEAALLGVVRGPEEMRHCRRTMYLDLTYIDPPFANAARMSHIAGICAEDIMEGGPFGRIRRRKKRSS